VFSWRVCNNSSVTYPELSVTAVEDNPRPAMQSRVGYGDITPDVDVPGRGTNPAISSFCLRDPLDCAIVSGRNQLAAQEWVEPAGKTQLHPFCSLAHIWRPGHGYDSHHCELRGVLGRTQKRLGGRSTMEARRSLWYMVAGGEGWALGGPALSGLTQAHRPRGLRSRAAIQRPSALRGALD